MMQPLGRLSTGFAVHAECSVHFGTRQSGVPSLAKQEIERRGGDNGALRS
jgi:hypothetical protein